MPYCKSIVLKKIKIMNNPKIRAFSLRLCSIIFIFLVILLVAVVRAEEVQQYIEYTANSHNIEESAYSNKESIAHWIIEQMITVSGIVIAALIVIWQMGRQHKSNLALQQENYREQLRLQIYKTLETHIEEVTNVSIDAGSYASGIYTNLKNYIDNLSLELSQSPLKERAQEFGNLNMNLHYSLIRLFRTFENYEIVNPNFQIFQTALNSAAYDIDQAFLPLFIELVKYLPIDVSQEKMQETGQKVIMPRLPVAEELNHLKELVNKYQKATVDLACYIHDLRVESQNILLGKLFSNKVSPRKPLDPSCVVITSENGKLEKLERYFKEETPWGQDKQQVEQKTKDNMRGH